MTDHTEVLATLTDEQRAAVDAVIAQKDATIEELRRECDILVVVQEGLSLLRIQRRLRPLPCHAQARLWT